MRSRKHSKKLILFLALSALALLVTCADKIVNNSTQAISFQLAVSFENPQLAELVETYQVTIITASDTVVAELEMVDGIVEGTIENVPEGTGLLVVLEGLDAEGMVIYRGSALIDVVAGQITEVEIELLPVVKLIRTSPKFLETEFGTPFKSEIELYNLGGLTQIGLTIDFDKATLELDSVSLGGGLPSGANLSYSTDSSGKLVVNVSHSAAIVDSSGNAVLAQISFRGTNSNLCKDSTVIDITVDSLTAQPTTIDEILVDRSRIIINRGLLNLSKNSLQFGFGVPGLSLAFQGIEVIDSCGNSIPFTISTEQDWIDLNTGFGGLTPDSIYIDVDTTGLATGSYTGSFLVQSPKAVNSPVEVMVTLQLDRGVRTLVVEPGLLVFSADEFGPLPASQQFTISEFNSFNIPFSVSENISWLDLSDTTGTTEQVIIANIISTELAPGTYIDSIEITSLESNNSPQYIVVNYSIGSVPKFLTLDKDTLRFASNRLGPLPETQSFIVAEQSAFEIDFSLAESIDWLDLNISGGTTNQPVTVSINNTNLEPAVYFDSIFINSTAADNSPVFEYLLFDVSALVDTFPPAAVTDLTVDSITLTSAYLSWTASGDDSTVGTATESDLRYSTNLSTLLNWESAMQAAGESAPLVSGSLETFEVVSLNPGNMYYFGIEIIDNSDNRSEISNIDSVYLRNLIPDPPVLIAPDSGAIDIPVNVTFIWHSTPRADSYELAFDRTNSDSVGYYFTDITDTVFSFESLEYATEYYWAVFAHNDGGSTGWSNVRTFTTERFCENITFPDNGLRLAVLRALGRPSWDSDPICRYDIITIDSLDASNLVITDLTGINELTNLFYLSLATNSLTNISKLSTLTNLHKLDLENNDVSDLSPLLSNTGLGLNDTISLINNPLDSQSMFTHIPALIANNVTVLTSNLFTEIAVRPIVFDTTELKSTAVDSVKITVDVAGNAYHAPFTISKLSSWLVISAPTDSLLISPLEFWVKVDLSGLLPDTLYDTITVSSFQDPNPDIKEAVKLIVKDAPPTMSGLVKDESGSAIDGALIKVYDSYPNGTVLDSVLTNSSGAFEFFDIDGAVTLRTFKENHYPTVTELITPDTSLAITLLSLAPYATSDSWIDIYCQSAMLHGHLLQPNDVVEAYDPGGNLCGRFVVNDAGAYGFMPVYRDDEFSTKDEGCVYGDAVTIKVNRETARLEQPLVYPAVYQNFEVCFDVTGQILRWIIFLEPAGGEIFFIDSSAAITWSSNGTSDTLELYLSNPSISPILLEKITDDGEHTLTIPRTAYKSDDWSFVLVDDFRLTSVSDTSHQFTIDAVELVLTPDTLRILGAADKCTPTTQDFEISESHNYLIPYFSSESISWLSINNFEGNTSSIVEVETNISGLPIGIYFDSIKIESADAVNSPAYVYVELDLREFLCGDFNDDCDLKIGDLANLIDYLYRAGPPPLSADAMNVDRCDSLDIADIEFWFDNFAFSNDPNCDGSETCTSSENDMGAADSLKFIVSQPPLLVDSLYRLQLDLYLFNDANVVNGLAVGFDWDNPNLRLDSVIFSEQVENSFSLLRVAFESDDIDSSNANQRFLFAGNRSIFSGLEASTSQKLLASYYLSLTEWNASDSIVFDTLTFNAGTTYKVVSPVGAYQPVWLGPLIIRNESFDK